MTNEIFGCRLYGYIGTKPDRLAVEWRRHVLSAMIHIFRSLTILEIAGMVLEFQMSEIWTLDINQRVLDRSSCATPSPMSGS